MISAARVDKLVLQYTVKGTVTRSRFRAFVHLSFKSFMCGMKDSLQSKTTPRNLVSSTGASNEREYEKIPLFDHYFHQYLTLSQKPL